MNRGDISDACASGNVPSTVDASSSAVQCPTTWMCHILISIADGIGFNSEKRNTTRENFVLPLSLLHQLSCPATMMHFADQRGERTIPSYVRQTWCAGQLSPHHWGTHFTKKDIGATSSHVTHYRRLFPSYTLQITQDARKRKMRSIYRIIFSFRLLKVGRHCAVAVVRRSRFSGLCRMYNMKVGCRPSGVGRESKQAMYVLCTCYEEKPTLSIFNIFLWFFPKKALDQENSFQLCNQAQLQLSDR